MQEVFAVLPTPGRRYPRPDPGRRRADQQLLRPARRGAGRGPRIIPNPRRRGPGPRGLSRIAEHHPDRLNPKSIEDHPMSKSTAPAAVPPPPARPPPLPAGGPVDRVPAAALGHLSRRKPQRRGHRLRQQPRPPLLHQPGRQQRRRHGQFRLGSDRAIKLGVHLPSLTRNLNINGPGATALTLSGESPLYSCIMVKAGHCDDLWLDLGQFPWRRRHLQQRHDDGDRLDVLWRSFRKWRRHPHSGTMTMTDSTFSRNSAITSTGSGAGGAIFNTRSGTLKLSNSTISGYYSQ